MNSNSHVYIPTIEELSEPQLRNLYNAYVEYRDALSIYDKPIPVKEFLKNNPKVIEGGYE